jgi:hypothetical protein
VKSAEHITNYSAGHETRTHLIGDSRLAYPEYHIEADNRLSWMLGRVDRTFGPDTLYVHLTRDPEQVALSFLNRADRGIMLAYRTEILMGAARRNRDTPLLEFCRDYVRTVSENISHFLRDKPRTMRFQLETARADMTRLWDMIGAEGDLDTALAEWDITYNSSGPPGPVTGAS